MKKLFTILSFIVCCGAAKAQYVNIPDSNFRQFLIGKYPSCFNVNKEMDTSCSDITNEYQIFFGSLDTINLEGIQYFKALKRLSVGGIILNMPDLPNSIDSLEISTGSWILFKFPKLINTRLKYLLISGCNGVYSLPELPPSIEYIDCSHSQLNKFMNLPNGIKYIDINSTDILMDSITKLPDSLEYFNCRNPLNFPSNKLPLLPDKIKYLNCSENYLTYLPNIPKEIQELNCSFNKIDSLPELDSLNYLKKMDFENNRINFLRSFPKFIEIINCGFNILDSLPELPITLKELNCRGNKLKKLPDSLRQLTSLNCSDNTNIKKLPNLPSSLGYLNCSINGLSYLPDLPDNLSGLICEMNNISEIKSFKNLTFMSCLDNPLKCIPEIPNTLQTLRLRFMPSIKCIPNHPLSCYIYFTDANYGIIPDPPLCNPTNNPNDCNSLPVIQSFLYTDNNNNYNYDINEYARKSIKVSLANNYSYTNTQGTAYLNADSLGTYTITAQAPPLYQVVPPSYTHTFNRYDTIVYDTFALQPLVTKDSLAIEITPINWAARPGFNYAYNVNMENVGTTILNTNCSIVLDTSKFIFDSCSNANFSFSGNSLLANFSNTYPAQNINFIVYGKLKTTAALGSSLTTIATASGGSATSNDTATTNIRGSYDPNDKQATPNLSVAQVGDNNHYIDYTIRFQNTGTDTAFTVVIADTLNANKLQINTLQVTGSSHNVKATQNDNVIFFEFRKINLPDKNTNNIGSNGFISFKIKPKTTLVNGEVIPNKAAIYFDYNTPVITNTAQTNIGSLPLTLLSFNAINKPETNNILLYWNTANELNTSHFIVETGINAKEFTATREVKATGKGSNSYYTSISNSNVQFVRLKMINRDGKFTYSPIIQLTRNEKQETIVLISPAKGNLKINVKSIELNKTKAGIVNSLGKVVKEFLLQQGNMNIDISLLANGVYYLTTKNGTDKFVVE